MSSSRTGLLCIASLLRSSTKSVGNCLPLGGVFPSRHFTTTRFTLQEGIMDSACTMSGPKHHIRECCGKTRENIVREVTRHVCHLSQVHIRACDWMTGDQPRPDHRKTCLSILGQPSRLTCPCSYNRIESSGLPSGAACPAALLSTNRGPAPPVCPYMVVLEWVSQSGRPPSSSARLQTGRELYDLVPCHTGPFDG